MHTKNRVRAFCKEQRSAIVLGLVGGLLGCALQNGSAHFTAHFQQRVPRENSVIISKQIHVVAEATPDLIIPIPPPQPEPMHPAASPSMEPSSSSSTSPDASSSSSSSALSESTDTFPAMQFTVHPIDRVPNWGAMRTPEQWNRPYNRMSDDDFVPIPRYDLLELTTPLTSLAGNLTSENIRIITAKLYYSTRFFGAYDLDSGEFTGTHAGIDLKLPIGTPVGALTGGRVQAVRTDDRLGLHVIIEHHHPTDGTFFSVYGHLDVASVRAGQDVTPGQMIGTVGTTGQTTAPHLHLQIDRLADAEPSIHVPYHPSAQPSALEAARFTVHPLRFIQTYRR